MDELPKELIIKLPADQDDLFVYRFSQVARKFHTILDPILQKRRQRKQQLWNMYQTKQINVNYEIPREMDDQINSYLFGQKRLRAEFIMLYNNNWNFKFREMLHMFTSEVCSWWLDKYINNFKEIEHLVPSYFNPSKWINYSNFGIERQELEAKLIFDNIGEKAQDRIRNTYKLKK